MTSVMLPSLVLAALTAALPVRADDAAAEFIKRAKESPGVAAPEGKAVPPPSCTDGIVPKRAGKLCDNYADCAKFCSCACTFDKHKWRPDVKDDGSTTCGDSMPETGVGMLPPDSEQLHPVPELPFLSVPAGTKATQDAIDGLRRLSDHLAAPANANRVKHGYTVRVGSCYRRHLEDTVPECGHILKAQYMLAKDLDAKTRAYWEEKSNPMNLGLTWPGRTPHSGGYGCDLILVDSSGRDCFDWRAGVDGTPSCSIEQRLASRLMDEEAAGPEAGGTRLTYEAWHYEWGPNATGCRHPDCADHHWPLTGKPSM
jgi:hypothetical protein